MFNIFYLVAAIILGALPVPIFLLIRRRTDNWDFVLFWLWAEHILIGRITGLYPRWYDSSGGFISLEANRIIFIFTILLNCTLLALFFYFLLFLLGWLVGG
jgi:hypothetical protein